MQRPACRVRLGVAEKNCIAALRSHLHTDVGKHGGTARFGFKQVHDERGHALSTALQYGGCARFCGVEVVVMGFVLRTWRVAQNLQAFAVLNRPAQQLCNAGLDTLNHCIFIALKKHALAGTVRMQLFTAGLDIYS